MNYKKNIKKIRFSNFSSGFLGKNFDISIHSKINNCTIGADINCVLINLLMQFIAKTNLNINYKKILL